MRQIVLDTETTGFEPSIGDEIIELACVELIDNELTGNYLQMFFRPQKSIDISAQNVHGISIFVLIIHFCLLRLLDVGDKKSPTPKCNFFILLR